MREAIPGIVALIGAGAAVACLYCSGGFLSMHTAKSTDETRTRGGSSFKAVSATADRIGGAVRASRHGLPLVGDIGEIFAVKRRAREGK
jgi:hypothetical protein